MVPCTRVSGSVVVTACPVMWVLARTWFACVRSVQWMVSVCPSCERVALSVVFGSAHMAATSQGDTLHFESISAPHDEINRVPGGGGEVGGGGKDTGGGHGGGYQGRYWRIGGASMDKPYPLDPLDANTAVGLRKFRRPCQKLGDRDL